MTAVTEGRERMSPENDDSAAETELTLGLPGGKRTDQEVAGKAAVKRGFSETVNLNLRSEGDAKPTAGKTLVGEKVVDAGKPAAPKAQVVGWPPVRSYRMNALKSCAYVKVAVDGAPYLRKVDLEMYDSYQQLLQSLEKMFSCFTICNYLGESKLMDRMNGTEYVPTYEDKDGDWMLVGDVPWKMFVESCKRVRLMKSSEAIGLAPRTPEKCSSSN